MQNIHKYILFFIFALIIFAINASTIQLAPFSEEFYTQQLQSTLQQSLFIHSETSSSSTTTTTKNINTLSTSTQNINIPDPDHERLKTYFQQIYNHGRFKGSAALYKNGQIWTAQAGYFDEDKQQRPINDDTKFRIASITKTFIAVLTLKAVELQLLSLNAPLSWYFPTSTSGIKTADKITIKMLLNHRSFLYNMTDDPEFNLFGDNTIQDILTIIRKHQDEMPQPDSEAGRYSNSGYYLLGEILSMVYHKPLPQVFADEIFIPCNMTNSSTLQPIEYHNNKPRESLNEVYSFVPISGFKFLKNNANTYSNWSGTSGAGGILSTPTDLIKFYKCTFGEKRIITLDSIRLMQDWKLLPSLGVSYGLGIFQVNLPDAISTNTNSNTTVGYHPGFGHNGVLDGFFSQISITAQNPGLDPLINPYVIYAQSCNGYSYDFSQPILDMNKYLYTGKVDIPRFINSMYDDQSKYHLWVGKYYCDEIKMTINLGVTGPHDISNWNEDKSQFETIQLLQFVADIVGQGQLALTWARIESVYMYQPAQAQFILFTNEQRFKEFKLVQNGQEFRFKRQP